MQNFVHEMLHGSPAAQHIMSLWKVGNALARFPGGSLYGLQEYEEQQTNEARFVKGPELSCRSHPRCLTRLPL